MKYILVVFIMGGVFNKPLEITELNLTKEQCLIRQAEIAAKYDQRIIKQNDCQRQP